MVRLRLYIAALAAVFGVVVATALADGLHLRGHTLAWFVLTLLFFAAEYGDLYFHDEKARLAVSPSEAILLPMLVLLSFDQVLLGVSVAILAERVLRRLGGLKTLFNLASFGCASAAAAGTWVVLSDHRSAFSITDALASTLAILVFALLTHLFTSVAIGLAEGRSVVELSRAIGRTTLVNVAGSVVLGLFLAAAAVSAPWMILLAPVAMLALYLGNRAIAAQDQERQRVEHLHAATRALVAAPALPEALLGFLREVQHIASATEARVLVRLDERSTWSGVRGGRTIADMQPIGNDAMKDVLDQILEQDSYLIAGPDDGGEKAALRQALGASNLMAVPLAEGKRRYGCLVVIDRVGAGEFEDRDARLLQALSNELTLSLESHRLFTQIAEERERFGRIFAGSQEGICLLDTDGIVRAWNPALEKISGHYADDMMDQVWSDRVLIRDRDQRRLTKLDLVGIRPADEVELVTKEGPSRWVTMVSGPVGETEGGGWVVLVRDVTAAHEVEVAKSDFLSTISHELRTPLTTIKGSLQVLGRGRDKIPENIADQMIDVTTRGAERLEKLVMNLLAVSQIESGSIAVFPDELSLEDVVSDRYETLLGPHGRSRLILPENPIPVRADRERLGQTVDHLLENAIKFGGPDGEVTVSVSHQNGYARLSVTDQGPGIASSDKERIFDRFVRLGDVLTRETQGAGIGLFIAKSAVEAMGGRIWVESTPGEGATFNVELPLARPMVVATEAFS